MSFTVFNNFLLLEDLKILKIQLTSFPKKQVEWKNHNDFCIYHNIINKFMIAATSKGYNFSEYAGYEQWFRNSIKVDSHVDKDEVYFKKEKKYSFPICSIIYYTDIKSLNRGKLIIENEDFITPKDNKLIILGPGVLHDVENFTGIRESFLINFWKTKPMGY